MKLTSSKKMNAALESMGIFTYADVIRHIPRRYDDYNYTTPKVEYEDKERLVLKGKIRGGAPHPMRFAKRILYRFYFETEEGYCYLVEAWNRVYLGKLLKQGEIYTLMGNYDKKRHCISLINIVSGIINPEDAFKPIYNLPNDIQNFAFSRLVEKALTEEKGVLDDLIPGRYKEKYRLCSLFEAYSLIHKPKNSNDIKKALRTLKYQEALLFELKNQKVRATNKAIKKDLRRGVNITKLEAFIKTLPFSLSSDQRKALDECVSDMDQGSVMYRLLQGDVGTGKTLVAALAAYANYTRSQQTALLAPTDSLARQHYETLTKIFEGTSVNVGLLVGAMEPSEKRAAIDDIGDGTTDIVVGTHALFSKSVNYASLGLAIIDEQHKFGVNQRTLLLDKGEHADLLLMSATPIPRTLTMTIYGDLDVSTLTEFPAGKREVKTYLCKKHDKKVGKLIEESLANKKRIYVVVPQIEGGEDKDSTSVLTVYEKYKNYYGDKVVMMHGQMNEEEKNLATLAFKSGICPIMVATSLIEVGIDVKEANLMIIYAPSHFSLSSLHQLRGRVGRDGSKASCVLLTNENAEDDDKLSVLLKTDDGFQIAEEDLRLRGPGELMGTKQSGLPSFLTANIINDFKIFECARDDAKEIWQNPRYLDNQPIVHEAETSLLTYRIS
ncbi:MAG: ATP-dependent DNA helicase RecG [Bacilli bacterium]|nr:ATP-dependent DNA helicase RecG [Bacilli bacterium]